MYVYQTYGITLLTVVVSWFIFAFFGLLPRELAPHACWLLIMTRWMDDDDFLKAVSKDSKQQW